MADICTHYLGSIAGVLLSLAALQSASNSYKPSCCNVIQSPHTVFHGGGSRGEQAQRDDVERRQEDMPKPYCCRRRKRSNDGRPARSTPSSLDPTRPTILGCQLQCFFVLSAAALLLRDIHHPSTHQPAMRSSQIGPGHPCAFHRVLLLLSADMLLEGTQQFSFRHGQTSPYTPS